MMEIS